MGSEARMRTKYFFGEPPPQQGTGGWLAASLEQLHTESSILAASVKLFGERVNLVSFHYDEKDQYCQSPSSNFFRVQKEITLQ